MAEEAVDILLVEDNPSDVELTLHVIRKHKFGDRIEVVRDGADALDFVNGTGAYAGRNRKLVPRVILLDLKLPK